MRTSVNHPLHIVLSLLTSGLWLIVYAFILIEDGKRRGLEEALEVQVEMAKAEAESEHTLAAIAQDDPELVARLRAELHAARADALAAGVDPRALLLAHKASRSALDVPPF